MRIVEERKCRVCGSELKDVLNLGEIYPSSFVKEGEDLSLYSKAPLVLAECVHCGLVQLRHTVDLDSMYKKQYWYASSLNKSMVSSLKDIVDYVEKFISLKAHDTVLDIGCNDGTLLNMYKEDGLLRIGFDPAPNLLDNQEFFFENDYFTADRFPGGRKAKVVTAIAMFYDLPDPNRFVEDVKLILDESGIFVVQFTDLLSMFKACAFDNICHEHLEYYRLRDVVDLFRNHGLDVIDVSYNDVNGGSIRITACHEGRYIPNSSVATALFKEIEFLKTNSFKNFVKKIETIKFKIREFLEWAEWHNHSVYLMGASTKGNTLLQICNITSENVPYAADVNKEKFGLRTIGTNIKIVSEEEALIKHPSHFIVPIWHFKKSLFNNPRIMDYMKAGGRLVFPLPEFTVAYLDFEGNIKEVRI